MASNPQNRKQSTRGYEKWRGQNTICFEGRVIGGPQTDRLIRTVVLIVIPTICFLVLTVPKLMKNGMWYPLPTTLVLLLCSIGSLLRTAFTDPGIIPRPSKKQTILKRQSPTSNVIAKPRLKQDIMINGKVVHLKWCTTCRLFRPPRAFHCPICDNCVERFDHHCPWIGNCIGLRNYGWFHAFLWFTDALCIFVLATSIELILLVAEEEEHGSKWKKASKAFGKEWPTLTIAIFVGLVMWFVIALTVFHVYLVILNKTTNEKLRNFYPHGSPYSLGLCGNMANMCCTIPESNVHIHHEQPNVEENEDYVRKKKIRFVPGGDMAAPSDKEATKSPSEEPDEVNQEQVFLKLY